MYVTVRSNQSYPTVRDAIPANEISVNETVARDARVAVPVFSLTISMRYLAVHLNVKTYRLDGNVVKYLKLFITRLTTV